ncbi:MAG TPA: hypothetical protein DCE44_03155 [Verrucomicrobiales bacterium]|nr:hypothetical protein [Verrucomicrobiales bacterium]
MVFVSVSRASDGQPVTGLGLDNFRIASSAGSILDPKPVLVSEVEWEPATGEPAGCYRLSIERGHSVTDKPGDVSQWSKGETYSFGVQVRIFETHQIDGRPVQVPVDWGQVVLAIESLGT